MLTFFTTCKPFRGAAAVAQRNAIRSWLRLGRGCEVVLVGDDEGTAEAARELGARHAPTVRRNDYGTPLLDSVVEQAGAIARHDLVCYINADIMLTSDFLDAVARLEPERLLMISRRWNVTIDGRWDFDDPAWEGKLREHTLAHGVQKSPHGGPDYFVFQRYQWPEIPPFALGRTAFDNWLIYAAIARGFPVIDASPCVMALHQNHDCGHADGGWHGAWFGDEAERNRALAADGADTYTFLDATHLMTADGLKPAMSPAHMARRHERHQAKWFDRQLFLANALHELGRHDDELAAVKQAARAATTPDSLGRYARAALRALLATGRANEAAQLVSELVASDPSPLAAYRLASVCEELHAFDLAAALFRAVITDERHEATGLNAGAQYHLAQIAAQAGDRQAARHHAQTCLAENPQHGAARSLLDELDGGTDDAADELVEMVKSLQSERAQVPRASTPPADALD